MMLRMREAVITMVRIVETMRRYHNNVTFTSATDSSEHRGGIAPCCTRYIIWSGVPPEVAFDTACIRTEVWTDKR